MTESQETWILQQLDEHGAPCEPPFWLAWSGVTGRVKDARPFRAAEDALDAAPTRHWRVVRAPPPTPDAKDRA